MVFCDHPGDLIISRLREEIHRSFCFVFHLEEHV